MDNECVVRRRGWGGACWMSCLCYLSMFCSSLTGDTAPQSVIYLSGSSSDVQPGALQASSSSPAR